MENRYRWSRADIQELRNVTQAAHYALVEASDLVNQLVADMESDTTWSTEHKVAFMAWMDLLKQYHAKMVEESIGPAAVRILDDFLNTTLDFPQSSALYQALGNIK